MAFSTEVTVNTLTDTVTGAEYRASMVDGIPSYVNIDDETEVIPMADPNKSNPLANVSIPVHGWLSTNKSLLPATATLPRGRYKVTLTGQRGTAGGWVYLNTEDAADRIFCNVAQVGTGENRDPMILTRMYDHLDEGQVIQGKAAAGSVLVFFCFTFEWVCELP